MILYIIFGFFGALSLFFILHYFIAMGIDHSSEVKAVRAELAEIKKQLKDLNKSNQ